MIIFSDEERYFSKFREDNSWTTSTASGASEKYSYLQFFDAICSPEKGLNSMPYQFFFLF